MKKLSPSSTTDAQSQLSLAGGAETTTDSEQAPVSRAPNRRASAEEMASKQREISVSEFFTKNRHLLGFDNPAKALLTSIKEAVDNSLDACEEAGILPDIRVEVIEISEKRYRVIVEDNGPGIVKQQVPKIFAKLLYGSKFHRLKQSRGQQGIGISAAGLYALLTTGKPIVIVSKTDPSHQARHFELRINTRTNSPEVLVDQVVDWEAEHGTRVELEMEGTYRGGRTSIDAYLEQTVIANPHLRLTYLLPRVPEPVVFERATNELPREALEIKPHPNGVELGLLIRMMHESRTITVKQCLIDSFSRVSSSVAEQVCVGAGVDPNEKASKLDGDQVEAIHKSLATVKVLAPPASCVVPIGEDLVIAGLKRRFDAEFFVAVTRPPAVYRGNPFVVECGIAYGGKLPTDEQADVMRFANRVPLQYQPKACAMSEAVYQTNWKAYEMQQPKGSLPIGPVAVFLHLASVWVPFTSEAKEAVAHYPELLREMKLALQEAGRRLGTHLRARSRAENAQKRRSIFERYIPEISSAISRITGDNSEKVAQAFFDALPEFVKSFELEEEEAPASENPDDTSGPAPSMRPPSDAQDDQSPLSVAPAASDAEPEPVVEEKKPRGRPKSKRNDQLDLVK
jgi:DNA topoisomerase-6 subunit B